MLRVKDTVPIYNVSGFERVRSIRYVSWLSQKVAGAPSKINRSNTMEQIQLALVYDIEHERRQRVIAFMLDENNVRAFTLLGWDMAKVIRTAKRAVALGMK